MQIWNNRVDHHVDITDHPLVHVIEAPDNIMDINGELCKTIDELDNKGVGSYDSINAKVSTFTGWKTFEPEPFQTLMDWAGAVASEISLDRFGVNFVGTYTHCWGMRYSKGDFSPAHGHFPAVWSWVYYPLINGENIAPLQFPYSLKSIMDDEGDRISETRIIDDVALSVPAQTGRLVLFQSHIYHQVPTITDDNLRYVIAGNMAHDFTRDEALF